MRDRLDLVFCGFKKGLLKKGRLEGRGHFKHTLKGSRTRQNIYSLDTPLMTPPLKTCCKKHIKAI
jgi:hypothetical protein